MCVLLGGFEGAPAARLRDAGVRTAQADGVALALACARGRRSEAARVERGELRGSEQGHHGATGQRAQCRGRIRRDQERSGGTHHARVAATRPAMVSDGVGAPASLTAAGARAARREGGRAHIGGGRHARLLDVAPGQDRLRDEAAEHHCGQDHHQRPAPPERHRHQLR